MMDPAEVVKQVRRRAQPSGWRIHTLPRRPWVFPAIGYSLVAVGISNVARTAIHGPVGVGVAVLPWIAVAARALPEWGPRGKVIITEDAVVVYRPWRLFRRVRALDFSDVRGMVVEKVAMTRVDTVTDHVDEGTVYQLHLKWFHGRTKAWSPDIRIQYAGREWASLPLCRDVVELFERRHSNDTVGLSAETSSRSRF